MSPDDEKEVTEFFRDLPDRAIENSLVIGDYIQVDLVTEIESSTIDAVIATSKYRGTIGTVLNDKSKREIKIIYVASMRSDEVCALYFSDTNGVIVPFGQSATFLRKGSDRCNPSQIRIVCNIGGGTYVVRSPTTVH